LEIRVSTQEFREYENTQFIAEIHTRKNQSELRDFEKELVGAALEI
jgi:hypothetical protein